MNDNIWTPAVVSIWDSNKRFFSPELEEFTWKNQEKALSLMWWVEWHNTYYWENLEFLPENYDKETLEVIVHFDGLLIRLLD